MKKIFLLLLILYFSNWVTAQINWTQTVSQPPFSARFACTSFVVNGKGYVIGGCDNPSYNPPYLTDVWEYDFVADKWTQKNPYPGGTIYHPAYFVIGNFAYVGMGLSTPGSCPTDFYKYDPSTDTWTPIASYPGAGRYDVVEFTLNGIGYVGTGSVGGPPYLIDFYKYDPGTNKWTQIADFPAVQGRSGGSAFSYNGMGYAGFGQFDSNSGVYLTDFYAYDPSTNKWTAKASLPSGKDDARFVEVCEKFYLVTGVNGSGNASSDILEYDPTSDTWTSLPNGPFLPRWFAFVFSYNNVGYIGTGKTGTVVYNDFWKTTGSFPTASFTYHPENCKVKVDFTDASTGNPDTRQWIFQNGNPATSTQQNPTVVFPGPGNYKVTLIVEGGCAGDHDTTFQTITLTDSIGKIAVSPDSALICPGGSVILNVPEGPTYYWSPSSSLSCNNCSNPAASPAVTTTYSVTEINSNICFTDTDVIVRIRSGPKINLPTMVPLPCDGEVMLNPTVYGAIFYKWSPPNGLSNDTIANPQANPSVTTVYTLVVSDSNCSAQASIIVDADIGAVYIPNAFSPNNDSKNDTYFPIFPCPVELEYFRIYNRWGQKIFETSNPTQGWDGKFNQKAEPIGAYVYVVKGKKISNGASFFLKGNVTLIR